jgi:DNA-binding beta-propeller fold protein YncE
VLNLEKKTFAPMTEAVQGPGKLVQPLNVSVDNKQNKFIADPIRGQVVMYDKNDMYVKSFGPVEGWKPVDAVAYEGTLYVVDNRFADIKAFDIETGVLRNTIGRTGDTTVLGMPTNIAVDKDGYLYVSDPGRFQVLKLDRDGNIRSTFGSLGRTPGSFARPRGIAVDRHGRLYAVDASYNNVQIFAPDGQLLMYFGKSGQGPGDMVLPAKVAIDYDNIKYFQQYADPRFQIEFLLLVTNQFSPRRINVYAVGLEQGQTYKSDEQLLKELKERIEKEKAEKDKEQQEEKKSGASPKKD